MIITRTPFRISFFGGGTDLPAWYRENGGAVLSTTIDKYCYVSCRHLPPFFDHKHRIVYSQTEVVKAVDDIKHPVVRECIKHLNLTDGFEIHYNGDLPARAGLGTSSAFTVGLLNALYGLQGKIIGKQQLAYEAITIEQDRIKEVVGCQDQTAAAFGGFNKIKFLPNDQIEVSQIVLEPHKIKTLENNLLLFFTGFSRTAEEIEKGKVENLKNKTNELRLIGSMVDQAITILNSSDLDAFGLLLDEMWKHKRSLVAGMSNGTIDDMYDRAKKSGALGGKLLGAGGGGFLLLYVRPEQQAAVRASLHNVLEVPFRFDYSGSQVVFYKPEYSINNHNY